MRNQPTLTQPWVNSNNLKQYSVGNIMSAVKIPEISLTTKYETNCKLILENLSDSFNIVGQWNFVFGIMFCYFQQQLGDISLMLPRSASDILVLVHLD